MKKFAILSMVMMLGASSVLAASLSVPFWRDTGDNLGPNGPSTGAAGFIGIKNNVGVTMNVGVEYITTPGGGDPVTENATTFQLGPNSAVSWRPVASDAEGPLGSTIDNVQSGGTAGGAKITFERADGSPTDANDVQGRYVEIGAGGSAFSYLLPPGI